VTADEVLAYIAALVAHPAYTSRFASELKAPGIRIPLTGDSVLWDEAVRLGRTVIWLHTYGERFDDAAEARPQGPPLLPADRRSKVVTTIPGGPGRIPEVIAYDPVTETLKVGTGEIRPVPERVWEYEVSGMRVIQRWFDYRKCRPRRKRTSPLDDLNADEWTSTTITELLELLNVLSLCAELEPQQAVLLDRVCSGPITTVADLEAANVLPVSRASRKAPVPPGPDQPTLL
jgi:predicted helicase